MHVPGYQGRRSRHAVLLALAAALAWRVQTPALRPQAHARHWLRELRAGLAAKWKMPLERPEAAEQVTRFERHPVRFLSQARDGTLCFGFDGELYTLAPGAAAPRKLAVQLANPAAPSRIETLRLSQGATEMATSPDGQEVAFAVRGEIFVVSPDVQREWVNGEALGLRLTERSVSVVAAAR